MNLNPLPASTGQSAEANILLYVLVSSILNNLSMVYVNKLRKHQDSKYSSKEVFCFVLQCFNQNLSQKSKPQKVLMVHVTKS